MAHLTRRRLEEERRVINILASEGSGACMVRQTLRLNRPLIKATMKSLDYSRRMQIVFANVACGTFFKYYKKDSERVGVRCPLCPEACNLQSHLPKRFPKYGEESELAEYPVCLTKRVAPSSSILPLPL